MTLNAADAVYMGGTPAVAVYLGEEKVWPSAPPPLTGTSVGCEWQYLPTNLYVSVGCRLVLDVPAPGMPATYLLTVPMAPTDVTPEDLAYPFGRGRDGGDPRFVFGDGQSATFAGPLTVAEGIALFQGKQVEVSVGGTPGSLTATYRVGA